MLSKFQDPHGQFLNAVCSADADICFRLLSVALDYKKVLGVLASILVSALFLVAPRMLD